MKIAVTYENGEVFQHFGHTAQFKIYEVVDGRVVNARVEDVNGSGHGALASFLAELGAEVLICGGIGMGARVALAEAGIGVYGGVGGDADEAAESFAAGVLDFDPCARCAGHGHSCGGTCAEHSCSH